MHGWASAAIPALGQLKPEVFVRLLSGTEVALGTALLGRVSHVVGVGGGRTTCPAGVLSLPGHAGALLR
jgi:hypothetical protein